MTLFCERQCRPAESSSSLSTWQGGRGGRYRDEHETGRRCERGSSSGGSRRGCRSFRGKAGQGMGNEVTAKLRDSETLKRLSRSKFGRSVFRHTVRGTRPSSGHPTRTRFQWFSHWLGGCCFPRRNCTYYITYVCICVCAIVTEVDYTY